MWLSFLAWTRGTKNTRRYGCSFLAYTVDRPRTRTRLPGVVIHSPLPMPIHHWWRILQAATLSSSHHPPIPPKADTNCSQLQQQIRQRKLCKRMPMTSLVRIPFIPPRPSASAFHLWLAEGSMPSPPQHSLPTACSSVLAKPDLIHLR